MGVKANATSSASPSRLVEPGQDLVLPEAPLAQEGVETHQMRRQAALLAALVLFAMAVEVGLLCSSSVPWVLDKYFWSIALVFQALMAVAVMRPAAVTRHVAPGRISLLVDVCHWVFVVMAFGGAVVLRAKASLWLVLAIAGASLVLRISMNNTCIITAVAQRSSLPNISGKRVTIFFLSLFILVAVRLGFQFLLGDDFFTNRFFTKFTFSANELTV